MKGWKLNGEGGRSNQIKCDIIGWILVLAL